MTATAKDDRTKSDPLAEELIAVYRGMMRARMVDEALVDLQREGRIGFHVGSVGEEAAIVASAACLRTQDWIFPSYREMGAALHRGMPLGAYVHHMFGTSGDPTKGRQMPDHYSSRGAHVASISSPVGTQIPHAVGFAWAAKTKKEDLVTIVYFGEGATSSGEFHNGVNFAGVFKAPVILFCRSRDRGNGVVGESHGDSESVAAKGIAYGVPTLQCDGNDALDVMRVTRLAMARASAGEGPTLIEAMTKRRSDDDDGDAEAWAQQHDPIIRLRRQIDAKRLWTLFQEAALQSEVRAEIAAAIAAAEAAAPPDKRTMFDDVFATLPWSLRDQRRDQEGHADQADENKTHS